MLTGKKGLAMTSSTPGKTMLINHFLVNDSWYIVDLPGYGYARLFLIPTKAGKLLFVRAYRQTVEFLYIIQQGIISDYVLNRKQMTNLFVLIDSRHKPQQIDLEFMEWLGINAYSWRLSSGQRR